MTTFFVAWVFVYASVVLHVAMRVVARRNTSLRAGSRAVRVRVLRPVADADPSLPAAVESAARLRSRHAVTIAHAVAAPGDPARAIVEAALPLLGPHASLSVLPTDRPNRKAGLLEALVRAAPEADVWLVADGDVDLSGDAIDPLIEPLITEQPAALCWAIPVESGHDGADATSAAILHSSFQAFGVLGSIDRGAVVGKLFAIRADALASVGGFGAVSEYLGEDLALGRALGARGHVVVPSEAIARSLARGRSGRAVLGRYARWISVIRAQRPVLLLSYPLLFFPVLSALPLLFVSAILHDSAALDGPQTTIAAVFLGARVGLGVVARAASRVPIGPSLVLDIVRSDLLLCSAFVAAMLSRQVEWRGRRLSFLPDGRIVPESAEPGGEGVPAPPGA